MINPDAEVKICRDPEDNFILELPHHQWRNTKIVKPETFLPFLRDKGII